MLGLVASSAQNVQLREQRLEVEWDLSSENGLPVASMGSFIL
jgi:hypothetical protein